jgi:hypothetical protein
VLCGRQAVQCISLGRAYILPATRTFLITARGIEGNPGRRAQAAPAIGDNGPDHRGDGLWRGGLRDRAVLS